MNRDKFPYKISEYIQVRFRYDFLCDIKQVHNERGRIFYLVDIDKDDLLHHLKFDEEGHLVSEEIEPAFEIDAHDAYPVLDGYRFDDY